MTARDEGDGDRLRPPGCPSPFPRQNRRWACPADPRQPALRRPASDPGSFFSPGPPLGALDGPSCFKTGKLSLERVCILLAAVTERSRRQVVGNHQYNGRFLSVLSGAGGQGAEGQGAGAGAVSDGHVPRMVSPSHPVYQTTRTLKATCEN